MTLTLTWQAANGSVTALTEANGYRVLVGAEGLDAPPVVNSIEDYISFDGAVLSSRRRSVRQVVLPLYLRHPTRVQTRVAELAAMMQGPGQLTYADGTNTRYLKNVIYEAGLSGSFSRETSMPDWRKFIVSLLALDPWWYGSETSVSLPIGVDTLFSTSGVTFSAALPFNGGASVPVTITGDADASPVVTVYGPATSVVVGAGGQSWQTTVTLGASDVLIVDSRPGSRGPRLNGGNVNWSLLTEPSRLWSMPPGINQVNVGVSGSTGATSVDLTYEPRYLTP